MGDIFSRLKKIWDKKDTRSENKSHLKRSNSFSFNGSKEDRHGKAITKRNRIKKILNNFFKIIKEW